MVGGVDRYYQIARCLRDEDLRADRQYEFMQLDAEMSFVDQDDVLAAISEAVLDAAEAVTGERPPPIPRITWHEAMDRFGVDKPDLRFGMELVELTEVFAGHGVQGVRRRACVKGIRVPGAAGDYGRNKLDGLTDRAKQLGAKGLVWLKVAEGGALDVAGRQVPVRRRAGRRWSPPSAPSRATCCCSWPTSGRPTCEVLGQLRNDLGRPPVHEGPYRYVWVVDFPMFVGVDEATGRPKPGHHPFTRPHPDDVDRLESDPMAVRSAGLRPRAQRLGARLGLDPDPRARAAAARSSTCSASTRRRPTSASGSSSRRSATAPRPTAGSPSASTAWSPSSPARRTSAR